MPDDWTISRTSRGSLRCRHANGTIVFIAARLADAAATIARLTRRRRVR